MQPTTKDIHGESQGHVQNELGVVQFPGYVSSEAEDSVKLRKQKEGPNLGQLPVRWEDGALLPGRVQHPLLVKWI